jgi:multiple sugar transport system permease protein
MRLVAAARARERSATPRPSLPVLQIVGMLGLITWAAIALFPVYWLIITSLKPAAEIRSLPPSFGLQNPTLDNFIFLFNFPVPLTRWLLNSSVVSVAATAGTLLICSAAAYAFARKRFPARDFLFWALIASMLVPGWSTLVPSYVWTRMLGLHDTYSVLILPSIASPFAVFLIRQFLMTLPSELFDAAKVDGASELVQWWQIAMPLSRPVLAALGMFTFVGTWNEFLWPLVVMNSASMFTVQVGVVTMRSLVQGGGADYGLVMATAVVLSLPPVVAFLMMQKHLIRGLTIGALKG